MLRRVRSHVPRDWRNELSDHIAGLSPSVRRIVVCQTKRPAVWEIEPSNALALGHVSEPLRAEKPFAKVAGVATHHRQREVPDLRIVASQQAIQLRVVWEMT